MPELPEVETIARALRTGGRGHEPIVGRVIRGAYVQWPRTVASPDPDSFEMRIVGQQVTGVGRRAKFLVIELDRDTLIIHLRMSGDIRVEPAFGLGGELISPQPHDRLVIDFVDGARMAFNDPRKFGRVWLVGDPAEVLGSLGPEPLDDAFTVEELRRRMRSVNRQIKPLLLDQGFLAGLGNIYTDEALHLAGIHPLRPSSSISDEQIERLWAAIRAVLSEGIRRNGASFDWVYRGGDFQNYFNVYQREGQPCPQCGAPVIKITVGQRGTHFCPHCQSG